MEVDGCPLPEDRLYDLENDVWWANDPEGGTARVGVLGTLSAFAGPFRALTFRPVEGAVGRGRSVATVESTRYTGAVRMPVWSARDWSNAAAAPVRLWRLRKSISTS